MSPRIAPGGVAKNPSQRPPARPQAKRRQRVQRNCFENLMFSRFARFGGRKESGAPCSSNFGGPSDININICSSAPLASPSKSVYSASRKSRRSNKTIALLIGGANSKCLQVSADGARSNQQILRNYELTSSRTKTLKSLPILVAAVVALACLQNAPLASSFGYPQYLYGDGVAGYNYPYQSPTFSPYNPNFWHPLYKRYVTDDDSTSMLPSAMDSFTMDQSGSQSSSWNSMLRGASFQNRQADTLVEHTKNILIPRVSGTPGNLQVREYIANNLKSNNYQVEFDEFVDKTPIGNVRFSNIIARSNPNACRQLAIACHYDSKMMAGFLGATDSAVPCAMMLKMSERFKDSFKETGAANAKEDVGLMFVFFDGEEAFQEWTDTDSLYGSRHLAAKWEKQAAPQHCAANGFKNELARLDMMMVLDLIGAADTSFATYNRRLQKHYNNLKKYERDHLLKSGVAQNNLRSHTMFTSKYIPLHFMQDDHVPFMQRGVPILSLLAHPFPKVWHTIDDNWDAIDFDKTRRLQHVLEEFVANYSKV